MPKTWTHTFKTTTLKVNYLGSGKDSCPVTYRSSGNLSSQRERKYRDLGRAEPQGPGPHSRFSQERSEGAADISLKIINESLFSSASHLTLFRFETEKKERKNQIGAGWKLGRRNRNGNALLWRPQTGSQVADRHPGDVIVCLL